MASKRVIVVGTGPAGIRAVETLVRAGIRPTLVDESPRDGGQIYRRQPVGFTRSYKSLYGSEAAKAEALHRSFEVLKPHIEYRPSTLAWNVEPHKLHVVQDGQAEVIDYEGLIVCSGATDRLMPIKGWHHAGCYSLGAAQIALKSQACAIGKRIVFLGTGPLLYLVAAQYVKAGAHVEAVLDTSTLSHRIRALRKLAARPGVLLKGMALTASLVRAGVRLMTGVIPKEILGGSTTGVNGLRVLSRNSIEQTFQCDAIALGYHLRAETQLADLAHCAFRFDEPSRQWLPKIDQDGRSSVRGIYLAGDGARILGGDGAELAGRLAALAFLVDFKFVVHTVEIAALRDELRSMDQFRLGLLQAFPWPFHLASGLDEDTVVCRCESITVGELRRASLTLGANEVNRAKALSRVGMGRCQGRYCGHAAAEIVAEAANIPIQSVGRLRGQAPLKPLAIRSNLSGGDGE